jgi:hypothetical protein
MASLEIERDLDAVKKASNKAGEAVSNVKDGLMNFTAGIVHAAKVNGSKCNVM